MMDGEGYYGTFDDDDDDGNNDSDIADDPKEGEDVERPDEIRTGKWYQAELRRVVVPIRDGEGGGRGMPPGPHRR